MSFFGVSTFLISSILISSLCPCWTFFFRTDVGWPFHVIFKTETALYMIGFSILLSHWLHLFKLWFTISFATMNPFIHSLGRWICFRFLFRPLRWDLPPTANIYRVSQKNCNTFDLEYLKDSSIKLIVLLVCYLVL